MSVACSFTYKNRRIELNLFDWQLMMLSRSGKPSAYIFFILNVIRKTGGWIFSICFWFTILEIRNIDCRKDDGICNLKCQFSVYLSDLSKGVELRWWITSLFIFLSPRWIQFDLEMKFSSNDWIEGCIYTYRILRISIRMQIEWKLILQPNRIRFTIISHRNAHFSCIQRMKINKHHINIKAGNCCFYIWARSDLQIQKYLCLLNKWISWRFTNHIRYMKTNKCSIYYLLIFVYADDDNTHPFCHSSCGWAELIPITTLPSVAAYMICMAVIETN